MAGKVGKAGQMPKENDQRQRKPTETQGPCPDLRGTCIKALTVARSARRQNAERVTRFPVRAAASAGRQGLDEFFRKFAGIVVRAPVLSHIQGTKKAHKGMVQKRPARTHRKSVVEGGPAAGNRR